MKHRAVFELEDEWVLSCRNDEVLPIDRLKSAIQEWSEGTALFPEECLIGLVAEIESREEAKSVFSHLCRMMEQMLPVGHDSAEYGETGASFTMRYKGIGRLSLGDAESTEDPLLEPIRSLVGWDSFKELCGEIAQVAPQIKKHGTFRSFCFQNYLFSVNSGCGLTTALERMTELFEALGLFNFGSGKRCEEIVISPRPGDGKKSPNEAVKSLTDRDAPGALICFDISDFMEKSKRSELKDFLLRLVALENDYIFAFRIPFVEPETLSEMHKVLSDVLFVRSVSVPPFTNRQLRACAERILDSYGFTAEQMVWEIFFSRICEEKSDGRFYGVQSVHKIVYEMLWLKHKADAARGAETDSKCITREEILPLSPSYSVQSRSGFDELSSLIGMEKITERLKEIVAQVKLSMQNDRLERPCLHMRFVGSPGTGKTTVARIVGKIFAENGILRNGYFFEYMARDLCGEYVGQTAPKTSSICRDAYGSVLFLDEAYSLYSGDGRSSDYGREALTALISEMENHRSDMVVVMAGYKNDMETLMDGNAGLRSRLPFVLEFPNYTREQLFDIFMSMVRAHFDYDITLEAAARTYFNSLPQQMLDSPDFANARFVRNLYERTWSKSAVRVQMEGTGEITINGDDFCAASAEGEFARKVAAKLPIGFSVDN